MMRIIDELYSSSTKLKEDTSNNEFEKYIDIIVFVFNIKS